MEKHQFTLEFEKPLRELEVQLEAVKNLSSEQHMDLTAEVGAIEAKILATKREIYSNLSPWQRIQLARHPRRPYSLDYIGSIFRDWQELHGDRCFGDDQALIGGTTFFEGEPVMIIAQQKGRDTRENIRRNFGMPHPDGYRKALRLMELAERFQIPVISLIDTKAAYAGVGSEERHVSEAIARNLREMSSLRVPILAAIIGEGGSGGALGIGVANRLLVQEHAYFSVIPPEGCAAILWRDRAFAPDAAAALRLGARELKEQGVADEIVPEPLGGAHTNPQEAALLLQDALSRHLRELRSLSPQEVVEQRYAKFRCIGVYEESGRRVGGPPSR